MEESEFLSFTFPRKLWKIVESDRFKSIGWNEDGTCIVIDKEQFKKEILEKKGPIRIFETDRMKSFIRQLNLYGFSKLRHDFERSASPVDFLMEEKEAFLLRKLQLYYNPNFRRGSPHLLSRLKRRVGVKNTSNHAFLPSQDISKNFLKGDHCKLQGQKSTGKHDFAAATAVAAAASSPSLPPPLPSYSSSTSKEKGQKSARGKCANGRKSGSSTAPRVDLSAVPLSAEGAHHAGQNQFTPFYLSHQGNHAQMNIHDIDGVAAPTSLCHAVPPIQNDSFRSMVFPAVYSHVTAIQAPLTRPLPFSGLCYVIPVVATAPSISMSISSEEQQSFQYQHCPSCSCNSSNSIQTSKESPRCN